MQRPDILIFLSDQHNANIAGFAGDSIVRTPNLDRIAANGTVFDAAYTACPLCVPARISMLTGYLPSRTGCFCNNYSLPDNCADFLHALSLRGYETVLCGRMHFMGLNQRHGFGSRIMGDFLPSLWGHMDRFNREIGAYAGTIAASHCLDLIGGGDSPVLAYDRDVCNAAVDYIGRRHGHDRPLCLVVGTYGPHFPYAAPLDLYRYYLDMVEMPRSLDPEKFSMHPLYECKRKSVDVSVVRRARAAYYGMIEYIDGLAGNVYDQWKRYLKDSGREGLFVYFSDHGDQVGERMLFGKQTFYEGSVRIPLIFEGIGISEGKRVDSPVSIMDLGPTLCDIAEAKYPPNRDGISIRDWLTGTGKPGRYVMSEFADRGSGGRITPGRMIRKGRWKFISYAFYEKDDILYDIQSDPDEQRNVIGEHPEMAEELRRKCKENWDVDSIIGVCKRLDENVEFLSEYFRDMDEPAGARQPVHAEACLPPVADL